MWCSNQGIAFRPAQILLFNITQHTYIGPLCSKMFYRWQYLPRVLRNNLLLSKFLDDEIASIHDLKLQMTLVISRSICRLSSTFVLLCELMFDAVIVSLPIKWSSVKASGSKAFYSYAKRFAVSKTCNAITTYFYRLITTQCSSTDQVTRNMKAY